MRKVNLSGKEYAIYESMWEKAQDFRNELFAKIRLGNEHSQVQIKLEEMMFWLEAAIQKGIK